MSSWQRRVVESLDEIETAYVDVPAVEHRVPLDSRIERFREAVERGRTEPFDAGRWRDEIRPVAEESDTEELLPAVRSLVDVEGRPLLSRGVAVSISLLLDCLLQFATTPVGPAVRSLVEATANPADRTRFVEAIRTTRDVVRSTGLCRRCLTATDGLNFVHPDTSVDRVRAVARSSHRDGKLSRLADLTADTERADVGDWSEADLRGYADDANSGEPFEQLIAHLWLDLGYEEVVIVNDSGGDGGVDVVVNDSNGIIGIEVKRYDERTLRVGQVRRIAGVLPQYDFDQLFLVTSTTDITTDARVEAKRADDLRLVGGAELASVLSESSLCPPVFLSDEESS